MHSRPTVGAAFRGRASATAAHLRRRGAGYVRRAERAYWRGYHRLRKLVSVRPLPDRPEGGQTPVEGDVGHPERRLDVARLASYFQAAEMGDPTMQVQVIRGLLERDGHTRNLYDQRRYAVSGKPWVIQRGGDSPADTRAAAALADAMREVPSFAAFVEHQLTCNLHGYAGSEIDWQVSDGMVVPRRFVPVRPESFRFARPHNRLGAETDELLLATRRQSSGERLAPGSWVLSLRDRTVPIAQSGLGRTTSWYSHFKLTAFRDFVIYVRRFGIPLVLAKIGEWEDEQAKAVARKLVECYGEDGGGVIPEDIEVTTSEDRSKGRADVHGRLILLCQAENSKAVYGVTLANDNGTQGGASYALGSTHAGIRWENIIRDAVVFQDAFEWCVSRPFVHFNGMDARPPILRIQVAQVHDPKAIVELADYFVNKLSLDIDGEQMRQMIGLRKPKAAGPAEPKEKQAA